MQFEGCAMRKNSPSPLAPLWVKAIFGVVAALGVITFSTDLDLSPRRPRIEVGGIVQTRPSTTVVNTGRTTPSRDMTEQAEIANGAGFDDQTGANPPILSVLEVSWPELVDEYRLSPDAVDALADEACQAVSGVESSEGVALYLNMTWSRLDDNDRDLLNNDMTRFASLVKDLVGATCPANADKLADVVD